MLLAMRLGLTIQMLQVVPSFAHLEHSNPVSDMPENLSTLHLPRSFAQVAIPESPVNTPDALQPPEVPVPHPVAYPICLERLIQLEVAQADLCDAENAQPSDVLLDRYRIFLARFEGDDPSTDRDNLLLKAAQTRIEVLMAFQAGNSAGILPAPLCATFSNRSSAATLNPIAVAVDSRRVSYLLKQAHQYMADEQVFRAEEALQEARGAAGSHGSSRAAIGMGWYHLALISKRCKKSGPSVDLDPVVRDRYYREALTDLALSARQNPGDAFALYMAGSIHKKFNEDAKTAEYYRLALKAGLRPPYSGIAQEFMRIWNRTHP